MPIIDPLHRFTPLREALECENAADAVSTSEAPTPEEPSDLPAPPGELISDNSFAEPKRRDLHVVQASAFAARAVPDRPWLVRDMIPDRTVTLLSGDGGVGKSLIALQLGIAVVTATDWLGLMPETGPILYVSAEDDVEEIHRRLADITASQGVVLEDLADFHIAPLAGQDAVLAASDRRPGIITATLLWHALVGEILKIKPRLVIIENLADVFAGNENVRSEARQFIGMFRGVAIEHNLAVLLVSHPSLSGLATGTGTSGSTAWSNSVRSRLYLDRPKADDGSEIDPNLRVLRTMKSNFAPIGAELRLRWEKGRFKLDGAPGGFDKLAAEASADRMFLELVSKFQAEGRDVSPNPSVTFAPKVFAQHPRAQGFSQKALRAAMDRLLAAKKVRIDRFGPISKRRSRIVLADENEDE